MVMAAVQLLHQLLLLLLLPLLPPAAPASAPAPTEGAPCIPLPNVATYIVAVTAMCGVLLTFREVLLLLPPLLLHPLPPLRAPLLPEAWLADTAPICCPRAAEAIMQLLRSTLFERDPEWLQPFSGWHPSSASHHCAWANVRCDGDGRVTIL